MRWGITVIRSGKRTHRVCKWFGRTSNSNGDGPDHGWGSQHLVMGGAVRRRNIYGALPNMDVGGPDFVGNLQIPKASVEQYAATLGQWMGVSDADLNDLLPRLGRFDTRNLGFMNT